MLKELLMSLPLVDLEIKQCNSSELEEELAEGCGAAILCIGCSVKD